jgi:hypothetical protein
VRLAVSSSSFLNDASRVCQQNLKRCKIEIPIAVASVAVEAAAQTNAVKRAFVTNTAMMMA